MENNLWSKQSKSHEVGFLTAISCFTARPAEDSYSLPPLLAGTVMHIWDFVDDLARACKGYLESRETVGTVYGDKVLKKRAIYAIIKKVKNGETTNYQRQKNVPTLALIASVATSVEEDHRLSIKTLATAHGTSVSMIHTVLHDDSGLEKKSVRWVPKLLNDE